jgi:predicted AAA+ superfamily ATPase
MQRPLFLKQIEAQMNVHPVCGVLGPRQAGKTTLARQYAENCQTKQVHMFDLQNPFDLSRLDEAYTLCRLWRAW